jgi:hypothetical protein
MSGVKARLASPSSTGKNFAAIRLVTFADSVIRMHSASVHNKWERDYLKKTNGRKVDIVFYCLLIPDILVKS